MTAISVRFNTLLLVVLVLMAGAIITMLATRASGGPLDPPAAPSANGTLPQVEPRMPIPPVGWNGTFPIQITQSGSYFLTRNLIAPGGGVNGIEIRSNDVALDLSGFTLNGFDRTGTGIANVSMNFRANVSVAHGAVKGFADGINLGSVVTGGRISDVYVNGTGAAGTAIVAGGNAVVEDCRIEDVGEGVRLNSGTVMRRCSVTHTNLDGVFAKASTVIEDSSIHNVQIGNPDNPNYGVRVEGAVTIRGNHFVDNGRRDILVTVGPAIVIDNTVFCAASVVELSPLIMYAPMGSEPHANIPRVAPGFC